MMDFSWSPEQKQFRQQIAEFAKRELNDGLIERDHDGVFNKAGWKKCADMGIHGLPIPEQYGGSGLDALTTVGVLESLGYGCKDNGLVFSINAHMWTLEIPLLSFGTEEQKKRYLPGLCNGDIIGGNAMSEPGSGSDAYSLATTAELRGDFYILNGSKIFVTNGSVADLVLVFATIDPKLGPNGVTAFLVEKNFPGFSVARSVEKMGLRTSPMAELFFENCKVPVSNRLGKEGAGKSLFTDSMTWERGCILAGAVGAMERLFEQCVRYARERKQFGQSIGKNQLVSTKLVDMKMRLESARSMLYKTAWLKDKGRNVFMEAAMAKLCISENWCQCAQDAIQIHGGYGFMKEFEVERELRDATGSKLYSGTSEIQRVLIASLLGL